MQKITYTNSLNESIVLVDYAVGAGEYKLHKLNILPLETESIVRRGYKQDGNSLDYSRATARQIELSGRIFGDGFADMFAKSRAVKKIFNPTIRPTETGTLRYENDYWSKEIDVKVEMEAQINYHKNYNSTIFNVLMTANFPFWRDVSETSVSVSGVSGGFEWLAPTYFEGSYDPFYFGEITGTTDTATNSGDLPAPVTMEWTGQAVNPRITITYTQTIAGVTTTTTQYMQLNYTLASNEKAIITTGYNNKNAYIENVATGVITKNNSIVTADSTYFTLPLGDSVLSFSADSGASGATVNVKYKQLWIGV